MKVAILCEESGYIRSEFRRYGHNAVSLDLLPASDDSPHHIQADAMDFLRSGKRFDLIVAHPPCTALCVSGNRWYSGTEQREKALAWTMELWDLCQIAAPRVCFEQPVSVLKLPCSDRQTVQPWMFGCMESKATVLHLHGLPPLKPSITEKPAGVRESVWKMSPGPQRSRLRGWLPFLARPMAEQWGKL